MSLLTQSAPKKAAIAHKWYEWVANTYPPDTAKFLQNNQDPFANPVGETTRQNLQTLVDLLFGSFDQQKAEAALDQIVRIRGIQDFTPARAVRFVFDLKSIVRKELLRGAGQDAQAVAEMAELDSRIDELGLTAFNVYVRCREKIYELQATEVRKTTFKAFARAGLIKEPSNNEGA